MCLKGSSSLLSTTWHHHQLLVQNSSDPGKERPSPKESRRIVLKILEMGE
jgi:hypothetical protein